MQGIKVEQIVQEKGKKIERRKRKNDSQKIFSSSTFILIQFHFDRWKASDLSQMRCLKVNQLIADCTNMYKHTYWIQIYLNIYLPTPLSLSSSLFWCTLSWASSSSSSWSPRCQRLREERWTRLNTLSPSWRSSRRGGRKRTNLKRWG